MWPSGIALQGEVQPSPGDNVDHERDHEVLTHDGDGLFEGVGKLQCARLPCRVHLLDERLDLAIRYWTHARNDY